MRPMPNWRITWSSCAAHLDVRAGRILDAGELAAAGLAPRNLAAAMAGNPFRPVGPPRPLVLLGAVQPGLRVFRQGFADPIAILVGCRGIDHAGNVAGRTEDEADRPRDQLRTGIGRAPRRNVIFAGRQKVHRSLDLPQVDRYARELDSDRHLRILAVVGL